MKDLSFEQIKKYENKWVVLAEDDETILVSGDDAKKVYDEAASKGYENFSLLFVQPADKLYCG